jgi:adenylate cyclase
VLPFVNLSGDKEQEYFSDGLTEELLNSLGRDQRVAGRRPHLILLVQRQGPDIATVAHKLNVGAVLEGSVRRSRTLSASPLSSSMPSRLSPVVEDL